MSHVLLIDDDTELVTMLQEYLRSEGFQVSAVHDGADGVAAALSGLYHIAVLDILMPVQNGLETLRKIRQQSQLPILMLTARGDNADRILGLELGADDYVPKPCTPQELAARIRAILRRCQPQAPQTKDVQLMVGALRIWPLQRQAELHGRPLVLTGTEFSLLEVLVRSFGKPVSKNDLSELALGRPLARFDRNIDVHISSLRRKIGPLPDGRSCIQSVIRLGYQLILD